MAEAPDKIAALLDAAHVLESIAVPYALVGGVAVGIHSGVPRATADTDIAVLSTVDRAALGQALTQAGFRLVGDFQHSSNFRHQSGEPARFVFDSAFDPMIQRAEHFVVAGASIAIVRKPDLIAMKERAATDPARRRSKALRDQADVELTGCSNAKRRLYPLRPYLGEPVVFSPRVATSSATAESAGRGVCSYQPSFGSGMSPRNSILSFMSGRARDWFRQAEADLEHARHALRDDDCEWACFAAQQAAEKGAKAAHAALGQEACGHVVTELLEALQPVEPAVDEALLDRARALDKLYIPTRYPNGLAGGAPADFYTRAEAERAIADAEVILAVCQRVLSRT